jgi:hypothetical protein
MTTSGFGVVTCLFAVSIWNSRLSCHREGSVSLRPSRYSLNDFDYVQEGTNWLLQLQQ